jgi:hypothetical protein
MGLDHLAGLDKIRTEAANIVYSATADIIKFCIRCQILCSLENPENSLFWDYPEIAEILQEYVGFSVYFHHCMHGGTRNKKTRWWSTQDVFHPLTAFCDGKHKHATWNPVAIGGNLSFPTAEEAAYPILLCKRIVALLVQYAVSHGAEQPETLEEEIPKTANTAHRWIMDMLPKGKKMRPLVSEFQAYCSFLSEPALEPESNSFSNNNPKAPESYIDSYSGEKFGSMVQQFFGRRRQKKRNLMTKPYKNFLTWRANSSRQSFARQEYQGNPGTSLRKL